MGLLNLTESERLEILNLHNNARIIKEQVAPTVPAAAGTPAAAPQTVADVIKELQTLLNTKYGTKLTVDGKWGNLTQTAFETALKSKSAAPAASTGTGTPASSTGTGTPASSTGTGTQLPTVTVTGQKAPDPAIAAAPAVPLPSVATPAAPGVSGQPAPASATTATPEVPAAPATPAAPLSNRDQRRQRQDLRRGNRRAMQDLRGQQRAQ
jgi:hypothetical protein